MGRPFIVAFVGVPGSGKTTFAKKLAERLQAVILSSDGLRMAMWQSLEAIAEAHSSPSERSKNNKLLFNGMNYTTQQILKAGNSVVFDANSNHRAERQEKHDIALEQGAISVVVRIQVPYEVSLERLQSRKEGHDSRRFDKEKAAGVIDHFAAEIEEPNEDENVIYIDGEMSYDEQYAHFEASCKQLFEASEQADQQA